MYNNSGEWVPIRKYGPQKYQKAQIYLQWLGGNIKEEVSAIIVIDSKWSIKIAESTLTRNLMWQSIRITVWKSMTYKLKANTITKPQSKSI